MRVAAACIMTILLMMPAHAHNGGALRLVGVSRPPEAGWIRTVKTDGKSGIRLGTNITDVRDWHSAWPFNNILKNGRGWLTSNNHYVAGGENAWNTDLYAEIPKDADGYPLELPYVKAGLEAPQVVKTLWANTRGMKQGVYTVLYDGEGTFRVHHDAKILTSSPGKLTMEINYKENIAVFDILSSKKGNHVRNIRILLPGADEHEVFNPAWTALITNYHAIRCMDFAMTNWSPEKHWRDRAKMSDALWSTAKGVPYEVMIDLANQLQKDIWINIPHLATDDYIKNMARLFNDRLDPSLTVYVEYSNEIWNPLFSRRNGEIGQYAYATQNGPYKKGDVWYKNIGFNMRHALTVFYKHFKRKAAVKRVIGGWHYNPWYTQQLIDIVGAENAEVIAGGAYMYFSESGKQYLREHGTKATVAGLLPFIKESNRDTGLPHIRKHFEMAKNTGLELAFYEGGQHFTPTVWGAVEPSNHVLIDIQLSDAMYEIYLDWLTRIDEMAVEYAMQPLLNHYVLVAPLNAQYGSWGAYQGVFTGGGTAKNPKARALRDFYNGKRFTFSHKK